MIVEPVAKQEPISESELVTVFDVPGSVLYRVETKRPDGTTLVFDHVRAYTKSLKVQPSGEISIDIGAKSSNVKKGLIPYPYHFLFDDKILCALKVYNMKMKSGAQELSFALNYDLFCLPWKLAIIVHNYCGQRMAFFASRAEWERGELTIHNREVQMFTGIPEERHVELGLASLAVAPRICQWIEDVEAVMTRKGV